MVTGAAPGSACSHPMPPAESSPRCSRLTGHNVPQGRLSEWQAVAPSSARVHLTTATATLQLRLQVFPPGRQDGQDRPAKGQVRGQQGRIRTETARGRNMGPSTLIIFSLWPHSQMLRARNPTMAQAQVMSRCQQLSFGSPRGFLEYQEPLWL